jgi:fucose permease
MVLPFILPMALAKLERVTGTEPLSRRSLGEAFSYDRKLLTGLLLSIFLAAGGYLCLVNWSVAYLENQRGMVMGAAHIVLAIIGVGIVFGRITSARLASRFPVMMVLLTAAAASMVLSFFAPLPLNGIYDSVLMVSACVFSSGIYPVLMGKASVFPASLSPAVYTTMTTSVVLGALLLPFVSGLLQEHVGRVEGMCSIAVVFLLLIGSLVYLWRVSGGGSATDASGA